MNESPVRYFSRAEMLAIADKLERKARSGDLSVLTPRTAFLAQNALRMYAAAPTHDDFQKAFCKKRREGACDGRDHARCFSCIMLANSAINVIQAKSLSVRNP